MENTAELTIYKSQSEYNQKHVTGQLEVGLQWAKPSNFRSILQPVSVQSDQDCLSKLNESETAIPNSGGRTVNRFP